MMLGEALAYAQDELKKKSIINPKLESELLLGHVVNLDRADLYTKHFDVINEKDLQKFHQLLQRKKQNEPTAYILGKKSFYNHEFITQPGVLIPRPETEFVVESALENLKKEESYNILDLGCGTGCIGLSILAERPNVKLWAVDISDVAVGVCRENAKKLNLQERITILQEPAENLNLKLNFDCIVSNPPYISFDDNEIDDNVKKHEPHEALFCKDEGLEKIKMWSLKASELLKPNGLWVFEIGHKQSKQILNFLENLNLFKNFKIQKDLQGIDRVITAMKRY